MWTGIFATFCLLVVTIGVPFYVLQRIDPARPPKPIEFEETREEIRDIVRHIRRKWDQF